MLWGYKGQNRRAGVEGNACITRAAGCPSVLTTNCKLKLKLNSIFEQQVARISRNARITRAGLAEWDARPMA